jgi:hypothetical protein
VGGNDLAETILVDISDRDMGVRTDSVIDICTGTVISGPERPDNGTRVAIKGKNLEIGPDELIGPVLVDIKQCGGGVHALVEFNKGESPVSPFKDRRRYGGSNIKGNENQ